MMNVGSATPSPAQTSGAGWHGVVAPYFLGAGMNGTTAVLGREVTVDASFSDVLNHVQFGAMGVVVLAQG